MLTFLKLTWNEKLLILNYSDNMERNIKKAIKEYQCSGCSVGSSPDDECYSLHTGEGCGSHSAGTFIMGIGKFYLGLPKGFNRLGPHETMIPRIFSSYEKAVEMNELDRQGEKPNKFNVPVWKYLNKEGHTLVRGLRPRINEPYLDIFLEDCMDKFDCQEITDEDIKNMD